MTEPYTIPSRHMQDLLATLAKLEGHLTLEYSQGRLWCEADVQHATLAFLYSRLGEDARWFFGSEHWFGTYRPDVVCYYRPEDYSMFLRKPEDSVCGIIEIKFASELYRDLVKLVEMQATRPLVAWMVYGDHFSASIHEHWAREQEKRAGKIREWSDAGSMRGATILQCGRLAQVSPSSYAQTLASLNSPGLFWNTDKPAPSSP